MRDPGLRRYGAIVWDSGLDVNEAIRAVRAFSDHNDAIRYAVPACHQGGHWAVVDLATMNTVAAGSVADVCKASDLQSHTTQG